MIHENMEFKIVELIFFNGFKGEQTFPDALDISINNAINYRIFSPEIQKIRGKKIIYQERFITICTVEDIEITMSDFRAKVNNYHIIYHGHKNQYRVRDSWEFGCVWWGLSESVDKKRFYYPCVFSIWTNENFVNEIETLVKNNNYEQVLRELNK